MAIINRIGELTGDMTAWRRDFHAHPELAFEETRTAGRVADRLREFGLDEVHTGIAGTGVVGVLHGADGGAAGRAIGLRADMDALPMVENTGLDYASRHSGRMHACGHDGHMAMLLGAARYLAESRDFAGTVVFIFQPAEEGEAGGRAMVEAGLFERFPVARVFGLHNWPELPVGTAGIRPGPMMAAADRFEITVTGRGGHAAMPHHGTDPTLAAAQIITAAQSLVSRETDPQDAAVVSIPVIEAGSASNVIPDQVVLKGTARSFSSATRERLEGGLARISGHVAAAFGATAEMQWQPGYPPTVNSAEEAEIGRHVAAKVLGEDRVRDDIAPCMGAEDFAFMLHEKPGSYIWLGQGTGRDSPMVHSVHYDFNDEILPLGASYWAELVAHLLPARAEDSPA